MKKTAEEWFQKMHHVVDNPPPPEPKPEKKIPEKVKQKFLPLRMAASGKQSQTILIRFTGNAVAKRLPPENN